MDFALCVEEYPRSKPYADPYLAGIECAVVENEFTATHDFSSAPYRIKKLQELPELLQSLKQ